MKMSERAGLVERISATMDKLQDCDDGLTFKQFVRMICMDPW